MGIQREIEKRKWQTANKSIAKIQTTAKWSTFTHPFTYNTYRLLWTFYWRRPCEMVKMNTTSFVCKQRDIYIYIHRNLNHTMVLHTMEKIKRKSTEEKKRKKFLNQIYTIGAWKRDQNHPNNDNNKMLGGNEKLDIYCTGCTSALFPFFFSLVALLRFSLTSCQTGNDIQVYRPNACLLFEFAQSRHLAYRKT